MSKNKKKKGGVGEEEDKRVEFQYDKYSHDKTKEFITTKPSDSNIRYKDIKQSKGGKEKRLVKKIKEILRKEGGNGNEWDEEIGVKVDEFDKLLQRPKTRPGVDLAFCLTNGKILLVDAKFNQKIENFNSDLKKELDKQVKSSREILGASLTMESPVIVLTKNESQARIRFYSKQTGKTKTYVFMSEERFRAVFFNE